MKQMHTVEEYKVMKANDIRKAYKSGTHLWRCIDDIIALIKYNEGVRLALQGKEVILNTEEAGNKAYKIDFTTNFWKVNQIMAVAYILDIDYNTARKSIFSMMYKGLIGLDEAHDEINRYMAMVIREGYSEFYNVWDVR